MTHHLTTESLIDYIHGELSETEDAATHAHLQVCAQCRLEHDREANLSERLRRVAAEQFDLPPMVKARIWQAVRTEPDSPWSRVLGFLRPAIVVPVAAALVAGMYFVTPLSHRGPAPRTVDATYYLEQHAAEAMENPLGERNTTAPVTETSDAGDQVPTQATGTAAAAALDAVE